MLAAVGCGLKKPEGIPALHPAKVIVKNAGAPIANVNVFFAQQGGTTGNWSTTGKTDSGGVAEIQTSQGEWKSPGVPEGKYKIYLTKIPEAAPEPPPEDIANNSDALDAYYREQNKKLEAMPKEIPVGLTNPAKSPLALTVGSGNPAELTVDVSEYKK